MSNTLHQLGETQSKIKHGQKYIIGSVTEIRIQKDLNPYCGL